MQDCELYLNIRKNSQWQIQDHNFKYETYESEKGTKRKNFFLLTKCRNVTSKFLIT